MKRILTLAAFLLVSNGSTAASQAAADSAGIRAAALDYIEGWYSGDGTRMERALHPELAKRIVRSDSLGRYRLDQQSAMTLVTNTRSGGGKDTPAADRREDVRILDIYQNAASARIDASYWVDYLQLAKWRGRWVIVNVLWELKSR
ncbi:MAG TPA: nuclear transport factor 2 family protein [Gemmatimonadaceae bacterium]|nr:nuclear transport factor 2 family protein [Gemmatimonadaceae bacterium]